MHACMLTYTHASYMHTKIHTFIYITRESKHWQKFDAGCCSSKFLYKKEILCTNIQCFLVTFPVRKVVNQWLPYLKLISSNLFFTNCYIKINRNNLVKFKMNFTFPFQIFSKTYSFLKTVLFQSKTFSIKCHFQ